LLRASAERSVSATRVGCKLPATERRLPAATTAVVAAGFRFSLSVTARVVVPTQLPASAAALFTISSAKQQQLPAAGCCCYSISAVMRSLSGRAHHVPATADGGWYGIPATTAGDSGGTVQQLPAATGAAERVPTTTGVQFGSSDRHLPAAAGVRLGLPSLSKIGAFAAARDSGPCTTVLPGASRSRRLVLPSSGDTAP